MITDQDGIQSLMPSASPLMNAAAVHGLDVEKILAGDSAEVAKAHGLGIPVPGSATAGAAQVTPTVQSALASAAPGASVGTNTPEPTGSSAKQPQAGMPAQTASQQPSAADAAQLTQAAQAAAPHLANAVQAAAPILGPEKTNSLASAFRSGVQGQAPAAGAASVPSTISPNPSPLTQAFSSAQDTERKIGAMPTETQTLAQDESEKAALMYPRSAANPTGVPSPYDPEYRPTVGRRIMRGIVGGLEGFGEGLATGNAGGAVGDAIVGALNPGKVGATPYNAPNRAYSTAAAINQQGLARVNSQEATAEKIYTADTARLKDLLASQADLTKAAAAGETEDIKNQMAKVAQELVEVRGRLADAAQTRADATQARADAAMVAANASKERADKAGGGGRAGAPSATTASNQPKPLTQAQEIGLQKTKNKAIDDAQKALTSRGATPNKWAVQRAQQAFQTAQNEYEQAHGITEDSPAHVTVGDDLVWTRGGVPLSKAEQKAPAQPAPAATTQQPKRPAPPTPTVPAPPTPTVPAPQVAADMALSPADGQYHYRDSGKRDLGVVK
jgi:hypothetical protein